jgi:hypothetical protein
MPLKVLSMGGGRQTAALLRMCLRGDFERPDVVIFANTRNESLGSPRQPGTLRHLVWLRRACRAAGIPWYTVTKGDSKGIVADTLQAIETGIGTRPGGGFASLPFYVKNEDGSAAMLQRQCTKEFKIGPILHLVRELIGRPTGVPPAGAVEMWKGITLDEIGRARTSDTDYIVYRYPFIEKRWTVWSCVHYLQEHGDPVPPKSSCIVCPFHDRGYWRAMRDSRPGQWKQAVDFDKATRQLPRIVGATYLNAQLVPLDEMDLTTQEDDGQTSMFAEQCDEGVCDV